MIFLYITSEVVMKHRVAVIEFVTSDCCSASILMISKQCLCLQSDIWAEHERRARFSQETCHGWVISQVGCWTHCWRLGLRWSFCCCQVDQGQPILMSLIMICFTRAVIRPTKGILLVLLFSWHDLECGLDHSITSLYEKLPSVQALDMSIWISSALPSVP